MEVDGKEEIDKPLPQDSVAPSPQQIRSKQTAVQSSMVEQYNSFFGSLSHQHTGSSSVSAQPYSRQVLYGRHIHNQDIRLQVVNRTAGWQLLTLSAKWRHFKSTISVLNRSAVSPCHCLPNLSSSQTQILAYDISGEHPQSAAIKCFPYEPDNFAVQFSKVVSEYFMLQVASFLRVGPPAVQVMGFDIIVNQDCIQFSMEKCQSIEDWTAEKEDGLKAKLARMHSFQMVHRDIKPPNLSYSPSLEQQVFIDFGLSELLNQKSGEMTLSFFKGSLNYCSPELFRLFGDDAKVQFVDLYYNDVHCLQESFRAYKKMMKQAKGLSKIDMSKMLAEPLNVFQEFAGFQDKPDKQQMTEPQLRQLTHIFAVMKIQSKIYHNQYRIELSAEDKEVILKERLLFISFIDMLPYRRSLEGIESLLVLPGLPQMRQKSSYSSIQQKKISLLKASSSIIAHRDDAGILSDKYIWINSAVKVHYCLSAHKHYIVEENLRQFVLTPSIFHASPDSVYLESLALFIDLRTCRSSWEQKMQAIALFFQKYKTVNSEAKQENKAHYLGYSCLQILQRLKKCDQEYDLVAIDCLLGNLVILEHLSYQDLLKQFTQLTYLKAHCLEVTKVLIKMLALPKWMSCRRKSLYEGKDAKLLHQTIIKCIGQVRRSNPVLQQATTIHKLAICLGLQPHDQEWTEQDLQKIKRLAEQGLVEDSMVKQLYAYGLEVEIGKAYEFQGATFVDSIKQIWSLTQLGADFTFKSIHFLMLQVVCSEEGNWQLAAALLHKFQECIQIPEVISSYTISQMKEFIEMTSAGSVGLDGFKSMAQAVTFNALFDDEILSNRLAVYLDILAEKQYFDYRQYFDQLRLKLPISSLETCLQALTSAFESDGPHHHQQYSQILKTESVMLIYSIIYYLNPNIVDSFTKLIQYVKSAFPKIACPVCLLESRNCCVQMSVDLMCSQGRLEQVYEMINQLQHQDDASQADVRLTRDILSRFIRFCKLSHFGRIELDQPIWIRMLKLVIEQDLFYMIFGPPLQNIIESLLCCKYQAYDLFLYFHHRMCRYLLQATDHDIILRYFASLMNFTMTQTEDTRLFFEEIRSSNYLSVPVEQESPYVVILYPLLLSYTGYNGFSLAKLMMLRIGDYSKLMIPKVKSIMIRLLLEEVIRVITQALDEPDCPAASDRSALVITGGKCMRRMSRKRRSKLRELISLQFFHVKLIQIFNPMKVYAKKLSHSKPHNSYKAKVMRQLVQRLFYLRISSQK